MRSAAAVIFFIAAVPVLAASDWDRWTVVAKQSKVERFLGRESLLLDSGTAWLPDAGFQDGVIEFDVTASSDPGFHGLVFRAPDRENFEHVYLRSHLSGMPDATQYTPVFNGNSGWQIYASPRYVQPVEIAADRWVHVRVVVRDLRLELSVDGTTVVFPEMVRRPVPGAVGLTASVSPARFANFVMRKGEAPPAEGGEGAPRETAPDGVITQWRVSSAFAEKRLNSLNDLDPGSWRDLTWDPLAPGVSGIANLAMLRRKDPEQNTVFAATTIHATESKRVMMRFGFSDRVRVYLNGRPIYRGNDRFQSRDYRFLGTVGLFDELLLPLKRGDNELWFAVSEDVGGWAIVAQLP